MTGITVEIMVDGGGAAELSGWLGGDPDLQVGMVDRVPRPGELGAPLDTLAVVLAPGGAVVVVVSAVVSWLRSRTSDVRVVIRRGDREISLTANRVARVDGADLARVVETAARELGDGD